MVEKLALFQYKMDTLTASRSADQDFDLSPPERVKMAQEHTLIALWTAPTTA